MAISLLEGGDSRQSQRVVKERAGVGVGSGINAGVGVGVGTNPSILSSPSNPSNPSKPKLTSVVADMSGSKLVRMKKRCVDVLSSQDTYDRDLRQLCLLIAGR